MIHKKSLNVSRNLLLREKKKKKKCTSTILQICILFEENASKANIFLPRVPYLAEIYHKYY